MCSLFANIFKIAATVTAHREPMPPPRRVRSNQSKERKKAKPTTASVEIVSMSPKAPRGQRWPTFSEV